MLPDLATKVRECLKMPLKIFGGSANIWVGGNLFHNKLHHKTTQLFCFPYDSKAPVIEKEKKCVSYPLLSVVNICKHICRCLHPLY